MTPTSIAVIVCAILLIIAILMIIFYPNLLEWGLSMTALGVIVAIILFLIIIIAFWGLYRSDDSDNESYN